LTILRFPFLFNVSFDGESNLEDEALVAIGESKEDILTQLLPVERTRASYDMYTGNNENRSRLSEIRHDERSGQSAGK
jgi:hypothetical protein